MNFKSSANAIMLVGDNPSLPGGLSRIGRDLATLLCTLPEYRVAYLARGEGNDRRLPFTMYSYHESGGWGHGHIQDAWNNFSGGEDGIILTTDDPSRRTWFADPRAMSADMQKFLGPGRNFLKVGYFPIDSVGPNGATLGVEAQSCIAGYDKVMAASEWGRDVLVKSGRPDADWLPHGLWPVFKPNQHHIDDPRITVGCVMANQSRKDYPAAFQCAAALKGEYGNRFHFWLHTDAMIHHWNVYALAADYGLTDCLEVTTNLSDEELALRYSACDCTILPSACEGFGFPIAESLACGTACIVTDYAAGAELVAEDCRVRPVTYRVDTPHNVMRAVISGYGFAQLAKQQIELKRQDWNYRSEELAETVAHLQWSKLKSTWERTMKGWLK